MNGVPSSLSPSPSQSATTMNNGPLSSPGGVSTTSSPIIARAGQTTQSSPIAARSAQPEQIIVPVGNVSRNMMNSSKSSDNTSRQSSAASQASSNASQNTSTSSPADGRGVLERTRLRELVKEVDPLEQMDEDVEDVLLQVADDFIENVVSSSCQLAKHRRSNTLEAKDVQLYLERSWNMQIPGFGSEEIRPYKKSITTEAHKQRMALIRKTLKKY